MEEERYHFERVIGSFVGYEAVALAEAERTRQAAARLRPEARALLPERCLEAKVEELVGAVRENGEFLREVLRNQSGFGPADAARLLTRDPQTEAPSRARPREADHGKVRSTLHSIVREWSSEGAAERRQSYEPLLEELEKRLFPHLTKTQRAAVRVLVPGAGLGRLVLEVAARGFSAQGNEFSYHMLLVSNFLLNAPHDVDAFVVHPFLDQPSNVRNARDRCRGVAFPDVSPVALLGGGSADVDFSMAMGEFLEVYADQSDAWDAVLSCFFVDTAPVVLEYVDAIFRLLKPGGAWVNLGPLLYHWVPSSNADLSDFVDDRYAQSIELAWDELKHAILARGFSFAHSEFRPDCHYTANPRSMQRTTYDCLFFTAVKPH